MYAILSKCNCFTLFVCIDLGKRLSLLEAVNVTRRKVLTPRAQKLYEVGRKFRKLGKKLLHENLTFRKQLYVANKFIDNNEYLDDTVNTVTRDFILSQLRLQQKRPKGRRFTVDDKILALSLFKRGPKVYRLLKSMFALPSRKTLMQMLNQIPFSVGINTAIIKSLEKSVEKLSHLDRYCALMFDEMFLYILACCTTHGQISFLASKIPVVSGKPHLPIMPSFLWFVGYVVGGSNHWHITSRVEICPVLK